MWRQQNQPTEPGTVETLFWKPGEVRRIPRLDGDDRQCHIDAVDSRFVHFTGPWGQAVISHDLYRSIMRQRSSVAACAPLIDNTQMTPSPAAPPAG